MRFQPHLQNLPALEREIVTRALDVQDGLVVKEGVIQRAEHAGTHQMQQIAFAGL